MSIQALSQNHSTINSPTERTTSSIAFPRCESIHSSSSAIKRPHLTGEMGVLGRVVSDELERVDVLLDDRNVEMDGLGGVID